ncbi:hypothetical protein HOD20_08450 [archaeon]|jgi:hypothetical protein|nr:hypothetical protein [archaeon]MBT4352539.1 hypothetical protein [archaeon]MBT4648519.1 hypothetical protein [archaeon]MBT6821338.1 hypothetical protein [archaeon]MBT7391979.1 hypothetical protein [archaeon]
MSQIEQNFRNFLSNRPEIEKCYSSGLINRRALARHLIKNKIADKNQMDAIIAMLRRYDFKKINKINLDCFNDVITSIKDGILIITYEKDQELIKKIDKIILKTKSNDTLKVVVGSTNITLFIDKKNENIIKENLKNFKIFRKQDKISEISLIFPESPTDTKGILSVVSTELFINDILISEFLTASSELLIYVKEEFVLKSYEILKRLKK